MACHRIRFNVSSGQASTRSNGRRLETIALRRGRGAWGGAAGGGGWFRGKLGGPPRDGGGTAFSTKQSNIGVAVASNWFIGGSPRICSMVRRMLVVLYCVDTTAPRRV